MPTPNLRNCNAVLSNERSDLTEILAQANTYPKFLLGTQAGCGVMNAGDFQWIARDFSHYPRRSTLWDTFPTRLTMRCSEHLQGDIPYTSLIPPSIRSRIDTPDLKTWCQMVRKAQQQKIPKVVLARMTTIECDQCLDPYAILKALRPVHQRFLVSPAPQIAFLGNTPERLFTRKEDQLYTEALAGTALVGDPEILSAKNRKEFGFVKTEIQERLQSMTYPFSVSDNIQTKEANDLIHLHYPFYVQLLPHITDSHVLEALHPTSAMCGIPRNQAQDFIEEHEPFDRGWYTGYIGSISPKETHISVAIRCALIKENVLHLFSATGIIAESDPLCEWEELNLKIKPFIQLLRS